MYRNPLQTSAFVLRRKNRFFLFNNCLTIYVACVWKYMYAVGTMRNITDFRTDKSRRTKYSWHRFLKNVRYMANHPVFYNEIFEKKFVKQSLETWHIKSTLAWAVSQKYLLVKSVGDFLKYLSAMTTYRQSSIWYDTFNKQAELRCIPLENALADYTYAEAIHQFPSMVPRFIDFCLHALSLWKLWIEYRKNHASFNSIYVRFLHSKSKSSLSTRDVLRVVELLDANDIQFDNVTQLRENLFIPLTLMVVWLLYAAVVKLYST